MRKKRTVVLTIVCIIILFSFIFSGCSKTKLDKKINGCWYYDATISKYFVVFEKNGECSGIYFGTVGILAAFRGTYVTDDGYISIKVTKQMEYSGGTLNLKYTAIGDTLTLVKESMVGDADEAVAITSGYGASGRVFTREDFRDSKDSKTYYELLDSLLEDIEEEVTTETIQPHTQETQTEAQTETEDVATDTLTQEEAVMAWVCDYTKMTAEQFYGAGGYIEYAASGTNYDYYTVAVPMAAASMVEITKNPPYTIERTGTSYDFNGPGGWGYR